MKSSTQKVVIIMIALIAFALFVHYMVSPSVHEAFQEGNKGINSGYIKTLNGNKQKWGGDLSKFRKSLINGMPINRGIDVLVTKLDCDKLHGMWVKNKLNENNADYKKISNLIPTTPADALTIGRLYLKNEVELQKLTRCATAKK